MTAEEFALRHPKPWHYVINETSFSLRSANGAILANLQLLNRHSGIPQVEWNRHVAPGLATPEIVVMPRE
jgi:hypothetical protein